MSTTLKDLENGESICCGAKLYNDICSDCKEHSGSAEEVSDLAELQKDNELEK